MARTVSWLPRLAEIRKSVEGSVRSHYTREDLQRLFQVQPRAAGKLLSLLPRTDVAGAHVAAREELAKFLQRIQEAADVPAVMEEMRRERAVPSRKKLRALIRREELPTTIDALPPAIRIERGKLEVTFSSMEDLLRTMMTFALTWSDHEAEFARRYEPPPDTREADQVQEDLRALFSELRQMEAAADAKNRRPMTPRISSSGKPA